MITFCERCNSEFQKDYIDSPNICDYCENKYSLHDDGIWINDQSNWRLVKKFPYKSLSFKTALEEVEEGFGPDNYLSIGRDIVSKLIKELSGQEHAGLGAICRYIRPFATQNNLSTGTYLRSIGRRFKHEYSIDHLISNIQKQGIDAFDARYNDYHYRQSGGTSCQLDALIRDTKCVVGLTEDELPF